VFDKAMTQANALPEQGQNLLRHLRLVWIQELRLLFLNRLSTVQNRR
jgi:hypothetical protein